MFKVHNSGCRIRSVAEVKVLFKERLRLVDQTLYKMQGLVCINLRDQILCCGVLSLAATDQHPLTGLKSICWLLCFLFSLYFIGKPEPPLALFAGQLLQKRQQVLKLSTIRQELMCVRIYDEG